MDKICRFYPFIYCIYFFGQCRCGFFVIFPVVRPLEITRIIWREWYRTVMRSRELPGTTFAVCFPWKIIAHSETFVSQSDSSIQRPCSIICHKVLKGLGELQGHSRASFHRVALWEMRAVWCYTWRGGLAHRYLLYKCSTKSSFLWFGMQWTYIFNIWTWLTEGCFQFQMLTRTLFV